MQQYPWQLQQPIEAFVFDCDGTLSSIEGIDELAAMNGAGDAVKALTEKAMGSQGIDAKIYGERLALAKPTADQLQQVADQYFKCKTRDIFPTLQVLRTLGKAVFVVSAGLQIAVEAFAKRLDIEEKHVFAVGITLDENGHYVDFDRTCPMIENDGKSLIVEQLNRLFNNTCHIGDGLNDFSARHLSARFVGYGGAYYRESLEQQCDFYIKSESMLPLLPLALTAEEVAALDGINLDFYQQGLDMLDDGLVKLPTVG